MKYFLVFITLLMVLDAASVSAQTTSAPANTTQLQTKIDQAKQNITALDQEIAGYQKQINELSTQASSLSATVKSLELTQKKLEADIKVTENRITEKTVEIQRLGSDISSTEEVIVEDRRIIARSLATVDEYSNRSLPELLLSKGSLSSAWNALDQVAAVQKGLVDRIAGLREAKVALESDRDASERARGELLKLNSQLKDQRSVVLGTASEKNSLLKDTKQSESQYQALLAQKRALKESFEREVLDFESQLKLTVSAEKIPNSGSGVLAWPLDNVTVTQYFGNTSFSTANPQIYNGRGHTGVDFRASIGTPIKASLSGVVSGTGNTDLVKGCYSYGKWVMIRHANGLSTLYAHLSLPTVTTGQAVSTGEVIGYSGSTGYVTGPHLHYGVYATEGVVITKLTNSVNCKNAVIPLADFKAYLNPLSYL